MLNVERLLQIVFLLLVCTSGLLLGFSQQEPTFAYLAIISAVLGLVCSDWLKWIQLKSWVANILSIVVLGFSMRTFFDGDTGSQLIAVANLLIYLQMVLLFQEKSPRLYWQVSVLSLLQVVVATIFNLRFEGGFFFILYMLIAATALTLLTIYQSGFEAKINAKKQKSKMDASAKSSNAYSTSSRPFAIFEKEEKDRRLVRRIGWLLSIWVLVSLIFSAILFYTTPRSDSAWFGPRFFTRTATGATKSLELTEDGLIRLGSEPVMRCRFTNSQTGEDVELTRPPYFRGMALSNVKVVDGVTNFDAPYDRVYGAVYEEIYYLKDEFPHIKLEVTLEATSDPLIYACMPSNLNTKSPQGIEFCHEISAMTRFRRGQKIEMSPFKYNLSIPTRMEKTIPKFWPYKPESASPSAQTMKGNMGQYRWLTEIDKSHYPALVDLADQLKKRAPDPNNSLSVAREFAQHFIISPDFEYTLDFRDVEFDRSIDPLEDFVKNHKQGHCSLYAGALCLMLRSQGIPARVVVGYYGGSYNELAGFYLVTNQHAHAWVEAYIPPEDYGDDIDPAVFGQRGVWALVDGTPGSPADYSAGEDALDLARTLWQDYILGLDSEQQQVDSWLSTNSSKLLGLLNLDKWSERFQGTVATVKGSPLLTALVIAFGLVIVGFCAVRAAKKSKRKKKKMAGRRVSKIRRLFARAVSFISPNLGTWLIHGANVGQVVGFYEKLVNILKKAGHQRELTQSHREFANQISESYQSHDQGSEISGTVKAVTELFNQVRFGTEQISPSHAAKVEADLAMLQKYLSTPA